VADSLADVLVVDCFNVFAVTVLLSLGVEFVTDDDAAAVLAAFVDLGVGVALDSTLLSCQTHVHIVSM